jgi:hypothetical protein
VANYQQRHSRIYVTNILQVVKQAEGETLISSKVLPQLTLRQKRLFFVAVLLDKVGKMFAITMSHLAPPPRSAGRGRR